MIVTFRNLRILVGTLAAVGAIAWGWQTVRHARLDLVTLKLRNVPLAQAIERMERQTRETIAWDTNLQGHITADFAAVPLAEALSQIAEQVGAFSQTMDAVYRDTTARPTLQRLLARGANPESSGWTNLSSGMELPEGGFPPPNLSELPEEDREALARGERRVLRLNGPPPTSPGHAGPAFETVVEDGPGISPEAAPADASGSRRPVMVTEEVVQTGGSDTGPNSPRTAPHRRVVIRAGAGTGPDGVPQVFDLSPQALLLHLPLADELQPTHTASIRAHDAAALAQSLGAKSCRFFALRSSPVPGLTGLQRRLIHDETSPRSGEATRDELARFPQRAEAEAKRSAYERLTRLSPEQRARESTGTQPKNP